MAEAESGQYFDFVVVGAGLIGSAAAKYLSEKSNQTNIKVAVIGVDSPGGEGEGREGEGALCGFDKCFKMIRTVCTGLGTTRGE